MVGGVRGGTHLPATRLRVDDSLGVLEGFLEFALLLVHGGSCITNGGSVPSESQCLVNGTYRR